MKQKRDAGFSLIEVLAAIVVLAIIVIPVCSSMVLSVRMNAKAEATLRARLAVSSALETMMAEGIDKTKIDPETNDYDLGENSNLKIVVVEKTSYYDVTVTDNDDLVSITTKIREATS